MRSLCVADRTVAKLHAVPTACVAGVYEVGACYSSPSAPSSAQFPTSPLPPYTYAGLNGSDSGDLCRRTTGLGITGDCDGGGVSLKIWYIVLLTGQLIHGLGASPLYTLGNVYLDENVSQRASPMYLGLYTALGALGPAFGFIAGGAFLDLYGNFETADMGKVKTVLGDSTHELWYGAWWLGFVTSGVLSFLFALPMLGFARQLPGAAQQRLKDVDQSNQNSASVKALSSKTRDLPKAIWALLRNGTFMMSLGMQTSEAFLLNGFINFVPKLMKEVYLLTPSKAAFVCGLIVIPGVFLGNVFGGWLMRRLSLKVRGALVLAMITQLVALSLYFGFLFTCPQPQFAGIHTAYQDPNASVASTNLINACNTGCGDCVKLGYRPVCDTKASQSFFNPCYAGCTATWGNGSSQSWSGCSCVVDKGKVVPGEVKAGVCKQEGSCSWEYPTFLAFFGVATLVTFVASMPVQQVTIRCVDFSRRSLGLGLTWVFIRLLGSIPGPILIGAAIDAACLKWHRNCDNSRNCLIYDSSRIALAILLFAIAAKVLNLVFLGLGWWLYKPPPSHSSPPDNARVAPADDDPPPVRF